MKPTSSDPTAGTSAASAGLRQRLFLALWPDEDLRRRLQALGVQHVSDGRRVSAENLHATLVFLGAVDGRARTCAEQVANGIEGQAFSLILDRIEHRSRQGIVWAAASHVPEALARLVDQLRSGLTACGFEPEQRQYHAHVTLARRVRRARGAGAVEPIEWHIGEFVLVQSHTKASGASYQVLRSWKLVGTEHPQDA
jgi:RNA 2',3'-cyclic 3'-phosphodiesterase